MTIQRPFFVIPVPLGTVTSGNAVASNPASFLGRHKDLGLVWKSSGSANLSVTCDLGSANPIDFVSMMGANAQAGTTIRIRLGDTQAEVDGVADYDSGIISFINPNIVRDDGLYHSHHELPSVQTKRWLRIDVAGHSGDFSASMLLIGKKITPFRFYNRDFDRGIDDLGSVEINRWGVADERAGLIFRSIKFTLGWLTEAEYENSFRPMVEKVGRRGIVYLCFDPEPTAFRHSKSYLGRFSAAPSATGGIKPGTFAQEYSIQSMF